MSALAEPIAIARTMPVLGIEGRILSATGLTIQAVGFPVPVGSLCEVDVAPGRRIAAEVIAFRKNITVLIPLNESHGLSEGQRVRHVTGSQKIAVGPGLLGRIIDGMGTPCDGGSLVAADRFYPLQCPAPDAMTRPRIDAPMSVGIRSINALLTPGCGQRLEVFAGTGVGKSILLGMMARHTAADVAVIALVGERGREVGDFIERDLGPDGLKRSVVVVSRSEERRVGKECRSR